MATRSRPIPAVLYYCLNDTCPSVFWKAYAWAKKDCPHCGMEGAEPLGDRVRRVRRP
jgi:hypothetical protein